MTRAIYDYKPNNSYIASDFTFKMTLTFFIISRVKHFDLLFCVSRRNIYAKIILFIYFTLKIVYFILFFNNFDFTFFDNIIHIFSHTLIFTIIK